MSTWHQDQAMRRRMQESGLSGFVNPYQHATMWTVVSDPPGRMTTVERVPSKEEALQKARQPHCYYVPPKQVSA